MEELVSISSILSSNFFSRESPDEDRRQTEYNDNNLDWSFVTLAAHMSRVIEYDEAYFSRKRDSLARRMSRGMSRNRTSLLLKRMSSISVIAKRSRLYYEDMDAALDDVESWSFNIFEALAVSEEHPMVKIAERILKQHDLLTKFEIPSSLMEQFLVKVEMHYKHNPFHNSTHAADVMQTINCLMVHTGFIALMTDLEVLCVLITALLHDIEHTGTNNDFHKNTRSEMAKLYMVSILENHHIRVGLGLIQKLKLLAGLSEADQNEFKDMLCCLILATDMAGHFQLITNMKILLNAPTRCSSRIRIRRIMMLLFHASDISNPAKPWDLHKIWVSLLCREFFEQGDRERKRDLPISPNCDKNTVNIAASQIGFMHTFVKDTFDVLYQLLKMDVTAAGQEFYNYRPWHTCIGENTHQWNKNWSSLKYEFIDMLFEETAETKKRVMGNRRGHQKDSKGCCCSRCGRNKENLFNMPEIEEH